MLLADHTGGCEASVQLPAEPELGISATDSGDRSCSRVGAGLDAALERLRHDVEPRGLPRRSAVPVDPCSFVDTDTVRKVFDGTRAVYTDLHECEFTGGTATLSVSVEQDLVGVPPDDEYARTEVSGIAAHIHKVEDDTCARVAAPTFRR